jgi:sugar lactone lactonase YvrE
MVSSRIEVAYAGAALLGEGPVWHAKASALVWVDIQQGHVHITGAEGTRTYVVPAPMGVAVPRADGGLLLAQGTRLATLELDGGAIETVVELPPGDNAGIRFNDGAVDPAGRFWAGTMAPDDRPKSAALYRLDSPGELTLVLSGVTISNGLAWSKDGRKLYYIDTPTRTITRFAFDADTGELGTAAIHADTSSLSGWPDGMTIDSEGNLWVAFWDGWAVRCFSGHDGTLLDEIAVPVARPTSCAFGGPDMRHLYITTARIELDEAALAEQPLAGSLLVVEPGPVGEVPTSAIWPQKRT